MSGSRDEEVQLEDTVRASASESGTDPFERSSDLSPGVVIGRYRLDARLGAGAMGEVWSATDPQLERQVAIKLVHPRLARDPEVSARMLREARAMAKVSHRAVIAIHDAGETDGRLFLAMELVRGRTLGAMLSSRSASERADWRRWLALMIEAGRGLAAAHAAGVLHRDFKPDNILVDHTGRICVGDFGLASLAGAQRARMSQPVMTNPTELDLTITGALLGTPAYMSLEQLRGDDVDARSDQFSFCVATYEALYGERPYAVPESERGNLAVLLDTVAAAEVREPTDPTAVPPEIRAILLRGLAAAPGDRWPDLDALLAALSKAGAPDEPVRRRPYLAIGLAIAAVVVGLGIALAIHGRRPAVIATATRVQPLPFNATVARSPGGRFATASDRIDVTDPTTGKTKTWPTPGGWIDAVQFEDEATVRWADRSQPGKVWRWRYASADPELTSRGDSHWLGTVPEGDISEKFGPSAPNEIDLDRGGVTVKRWERDTNKVELTTFAPGGHRFAYLATERFNGHIVVIDVSTSELWRSPELVEPTGIGWRSDDRLLYGTADGRIYEVPIDASGFGTAHQVYRLEKGWAGRILVGGDELVVHTPVSHVRVIDRVPSVSVRDFEPSVAAVEVGFTADGRFLVWNPRTRHLERRTETEAVDTLDAELDSEPANATCAGDLLIAAERGTGGRTLVAVSLSTGKRLWEHPVGTSLLARCANDRTPPCFVVRRIADAKESYEVLALDPQTGVASGAPLYRGKVEDIAVRADGQRLLIGNGTQEIREIDLAGAVTAKPVPAMSSVRSIAYDTDGSVLYGGTIIGGSYAVGRFAEDRLAVLSRSDGVLLSMVRPSPTSAQILTLGRTVSSDLFELHLP